MFYDVTTNWWENHISLLNNNKNPNLQIGTMTLEFVTSRQKVEASTFQWVLMEE